MVIKSSLAVIFGLLVGGLFVLFTDTSPLQAYRALLGAGFGCEKATNCAILTALQYATPLILSGLSAAVAFHAGIFSIGQAGQMVLGASAAAWIGSNLRLTDHLHPLVALSGAALIGAMWAIIPGLLKVLLGVNEIIVTLVMNKIAVLIVSSIHLGRISLTARLSALSVGTKLNTGIFLALAALVFVYILLWRTGGGFEQRMSGQAPFFARYAGIHRTRAVVTAMAISGGLAGIAGSVEILGVHYHFVTNFSQEDNFDGIIVALMGQLHPLGILVSGIFLGGVRLGALNGLLLQAGVPRELGGMMVALMLLFMCAGQLYRIDMFQIQARAAAFVNRLSSQRFRD